MAHNLMTLADGRTAMMYNKRNGLPWHELGQAVDGAATWQQAMQLAGMDWTVSKRPLYGRFPGIDDSPAFLPVSAWGMFRDDNNGFLGTVGDVYTPIQNQEAFDFVDTLLEAENGAHYDTAGVLGNGERIFVSASIPYSIAPDRAPGDKSNCYLMFETSHDGSLSATAKLTTIRVVCQNTLSMALSNKGFGTLKVRHSASGSEKLDKAKRILQGVHQSVETLREKFNLLANRRTDEKTNQAIMAALLGKDWQDSTIKRNQVQEIAYLFASNDRNAFPEIKGSAYNMLQAVTNWSDHKRTVRKTDSTASMSYSAIRAQSAVFNGGDSFKSQALDTILALTETCPAMPDVPRSFPSAAIPQAAQTPTVTLYEEPKTQQTNLLDSILSQVAV